MNNHCKNQLIIELDLEWDQIINHFSINDEHHKLNGPTIIHKNGSKEWFIDDLPHNQNGPAFLSIDGYKEWCVNGRFIKNNSYE